MYTEDVSLLVCPRTGNSLEIAEIAKSASDGELLEATLRTSDGTHTYAVRNGIPRFVDDIGYNPTWDFKWRVLDGGRGLNYRIIDKSDPAYQIHDLFDRNAHGGGAYEHGRGGVALDVGCGVGQYSVRLLQDYGPSKLISFDLTGGVDVFRKVVEERYPELKRRLLIVQADIFAMPFKKESFDLVFSLGVLMHTGDTRRAVGNILDLVKPQGHVNFWIYGSEPVAYAVSEPSRGFVLNMRTITEIQTRFRRVQWWIRLFRNRLPHAWTVNILRFMSSDFMYRLVKRPRWRWLYQWFPTVDHPDAAYRLINNYDGYVNKWSDSWSEGEIFPLLRDRGFVIRGLSEWRLGFWCSKDPGFYAEK
ncbi:class I SAM-dependent methyltransferase [Sulfurisoma sediminicola]|uniref:Methyltransferase family protein n=1 Tax=Sulfurisoma sediminicola TaxID=1381557 RepID=A0A497XKT2_9PROT|nr:class I SAM-dependent methyltransferase [Sulfurisoma sediminicola]RLJ68007.1 methyltransferase family protein [Sulfurisoma sediminicola]